MKPFFTEADCDEYTFGPGGYSGPPCISLNKANGLLSQRGKVVYTFEDSEYLVAHKNWRKEDTHTALLINIQPIEQDSAEKLVKDFISECEKLEIRPNSFTTMDLSDLYERAKKLVKK